MKKVSCRFIRAASNDFPLNFKNLKPTLGDFCQINGGTFL